MTPADHRHRVEELWRQRLGHARAKYESVSKAFHETWSEHFEKEPLPVDPTLAIQIGPRSGILGFGRVPARVEDLHAIGCGVGVMVQSFESKYFASKFLEYIKKADSSKVTVQ